MKIKNIDKELITDFKNNRNEEALKELFNKYKPLVNKVWSGYYLTDMDIDDWYQEAMLVMIKNIKNYSFERNASFGTLFKISLKNHLFDILRRSNAKKRMPADKLVSYSANETIYNNSLKDGVYMHPEETIKLKECIEKLSNELSPMELKVAHAMLMQICEGNSDKMDELRCNLNKTHSDKTIENCISRLKIKLKKVLKATYR